MTTLLYYAPGSASFLVHWLMIEFAMDYELRRVDFDNDAQKSPGYLVRRMTARPTFATLYQREGLGEWP